MACKDIHGRKEILQNEKRYLICNIAQLFLMDTTTGYKFLAVQQTLLAKLLSPEGETYPLIRVEISSDSHSILHWTSKSSLADGRVDRFKQKYGLNNHRRSGALKTT